MKPTSFIQGVSESSPSRALHATDPASRGNRGMKFRVHTSSSSVAMFADVYGSYYQFFLVKIEDHDSLFSAWVELGVLSLGSQKW